jgi:hypothetical protein
MRRADRRFFAIAYAAWLLGIFAFFIPAATWNPVSRFNLTRAVVERGSIRIDPYVESTGDRSLVDGHWYSDKAPVVSILAVPAYAAVRVAQKFRGAVPEVQTFGTPTTPAVRVVPNQAFQQGLHVSSIFTSGLGGIVIALLMFELLRRRTTSQRAFLGSLVVVLGTPIFPYATTFYGHVPATALLLGAVVCLDVHGQPRRASGVPSPARLRIAGGCLALAAGTEYLVAIPVVVVALWFLLRTEAAARVAAAGQLVIGGIAPVLLVGAYHTAAFGAPWRTGYAFETEPQFVAGHASGVMGLGVPTLAGLYGLTFGVRRGLVYVCPIALLAVLFAARQWLRRRDWAAGASVGVLVSLLLANAGYYMWWGGAAAGPRHLIPGFFSVGFGIALLLQARPRWLRWVGMALSVASIAISLAIAAVGVEAPERRDVLKEYVWPRLKRGRISNLAGASNLGIQLGLPRPYSLLPLLAWGGLGFVYLRRQLSRASAKTRQS